MTDAAIAGLPMYDWPEVEGFVDVFWAAIREELSRRGIDAPAALSRPENLEKIWRDPAMIIGQVCSLNPVRDGLGEVEPLGTLVYEPPPGLPDPDPGSYYSVIVCRRADAHSPGSRTPRAMVRRRDRARPSPALERFRGARIASNGTDSQSGYWSLGHHVRGHVADRPLFGPALFTGSHRAAIQAVADGRADLAAIDVHSWRLAVDYEPASEELAIIDTTEPTPGVVCVTAWERSHLRDRLNDAIGAAVDRLAGTEAAAVLHISGFRRRTLPDFHVVSSRVADTANGPAWHA